MSWSYDPTAFTTPLNRIRLMVGDTNQNDPQLQDEEIQLFLDSTSTVESAAEMAVRSLMGRYARYVDKWVGDLKILASQRFRAYQTILAGLTVTNAATGIPYAGGIRISDKQATEENDDLVTPAFRRDIHDFEGEPG